MSKSAFAQAIIKQLDGAIGTDGLSYSSGTANSAMSAVAQAITDYIIANTKVDISYNGMVASAIPYPDPVTSDTFEVKGQCAPPAPSDHFDSWFQEVQNNIIAGFMLAPTGEKGVAFPQKPFLKPAPTVLRTNLTDAHDVGDSDPQPKIWELVCQGLMDWINNSAINPAPGAANRKSAPSTGIAAITKITIT